MDNNETKKIEVGVNDGFSIISKDELQQYVRDGKVSQEVLKNIVRAQKEGINLNEEQTKAVTSIMVDYAGEINDMIREEHEGPTIDASEMDVLDSFLDEKDNATDKDDMDVLDNFLDNGDDSKHGDAKASTPTGTFAKKRAKVNDKLQSKKTNKNDSKGNGNTPAAASSDGDGDHVSIRRTTRRPHRKDDPTKAVATPKTQTTVNRPKISPKKLAQIQSDAQNNINDIKKNIDPVIDVNNLPVSVDPNINNAPAAVDPVPVNTDPTLPVSMNSVPDPVDPVATVDPIPAAAAINAVPADPIETDPDILSDTDKRSFVFGLKTLAGKFGLNRAESRALMLKTIDEMYAEHDARLLAREALELGIKEGKSEEEVLRSMIGIFIEAGLSKGQAIEISEELMKEVNYADMQHVFSHNQNKAEGEIESAAMPVTESLPTGEVVSVVSASVGPVKAKGEPAVGGEEPVVTNEPVLSRTNVEEGAAGNYEHRQDIIDRATDLHELPLDNMKRTLSWMALKSDPQFSRFDTEEKETLDRIVNGKPTKEDFISLGARVPDFLDLEESILEAEERENLETEEPDDIDFNTADFSLLDSDEPDLEVSDLRAMWAKKRAESGVDINDTDPEVANTPALERDSVANSIEKLREKMELLRQDTQEVVEELNTPETESGVENDDLEEVVVESLNLNDELGIPTQQENERASSAEVTPSDIDDLSKGSELAEKVKENTSQLASLYERTSGKNLEMNSEFMASMVSITKIFNLMERSESAEEKTKWLNDALEKIKKDKTLSNTQVVAIEQYLNAKKADIAESGKAKKKGWFSRFR